MDPLYVSVPQAVLMLREAGVKYSAAYFRTKFLEAGAELLPIAPQPPGKRKRRRLKVLRAAVMAMIEPPLEECS